MTDYSREGLRTFGKLVKRLKVDNNWSLFDTAKAVGIGSPNTISQWVKNADDPVTEPHPKNLIIIAPHLLNPLSGEAFKFDDLVALCEGNLEISDAEIDRSFFRLDPDGVPLGITNNLKVPDLDSVQAQQLGSHYVTMANQYWYSTVEPALERVLENAGSIDEKGILSLSSQEYVFERHPSGIIQVTPKDGRPPLTPDSMNNRDWKVIEAMTQKSHQKYGKKGQVNQKSTHRGQRRDPRL